MTSSNTNNNASEIENEEQLADNNSKLSVDDDMFLDTGLIHQGITDDDLDLLLSNSIKSKNNPPKKLSTVGFSDADLSKKSLSDDVNASDNFLEMDKLEVDDLVVAGIEDTESSLAEDGSLDPDEIDAVCKDKKIDSPLPEAESNSSGNSVIEFENHDKDSNELKLTDNSMDTEIPKISSQGSPIASVIGFESEVGVSESKLLDSKQSELNKPLLSHEGSAVNNLADDNELSDNQTVSKSQDVSLTATNPVIPATLIAASTKEQIINKNEGNTTMTDDTQTTIIEKVQVDIDELKRKLHSMNSDFYNVATDSAALIGLVRELETTSSNDFAGTYSQSRELRRILVEARKIFNQLASGIDMLEESLETDLFEVQRKN